MRIFFAWYDCWIGAYYDRKQRALYVAPLPCIVFQFSFKEKRKCRLPCPNCKQPVVVDWKNFSCYFCDHPIQMEES